MRRPELIFWIFRRLSLHDFFNMIMIVDVDGASKEFQKYTAELEALGGEIGVSIHCQREEIFEKMHRL